MKQDEKLLLTSMQVSEIQNAINSGRVSVYADPSGNMHEYSVVMSDDRILTLDFNIYSTRCEYSIWIEEEEIAWVAIPNGTKGTTPPQSQILDLFRRCANKVIWQETHFFLTRAMAGKGDKSYS